MKHPRYLIIITLMFFTSSIFASAVQEYTLDNGLHLIVKEDHRAPVAIFEIWYRVGASYEPEGLTGISHVVEHMMFEGTSKYPNAQFGNVIGQYGGTLNAFTDDDYTAYFEKLSADNIEIAFKLEADRMENATMSNEAFNKEIQVVMEERRLRLENQPAMMTYERLRAAAFISSPYHHLPIGWMDNLEHLNAQDVRDWYHTWYVPNNATIVIVGDVNPQKMKEYAEDYFEDIDEKTLPLQKPPADQKPLGTRTVDVKLPANIPVLYMAYNTPVLLTAQQTWQPYALDVLATILTSGNNGRLIQHLVREKAIVASINASYDETSRLDNIFVINAVPSGKHSLHELQNAIEHEIKILQTTPVSQEELQQAKIQIMANTIYSRDAIEDEATLIGSLVSVGLPWQTSEHYIQHIESISPAQIQAVAKEFLNDQHLTIARLDPLSMSQADQRKQITTINEGVLH
jgi:zinc protease